MPTLIDKTDYYTITADPNGKLPDASPIALVEACGVLSLWAMEYFIRPDTPLSLKDFLEKMYGFGKLQPFPSGLRIHPDDHLSFPGDPDMYPYLAIEQAEPTDPPLRCLIYGHAIVAIIQNGETFITRMD